MAIYLKNEVFERHYNESVKTGEVSKLLLHDFFLLASNIYKMLGQKTDINRDACINYAVSEAWRKWRKYVPEKSANIFAFFTSMIMNDMKIHHNYINKIVNRSISLTLFENNDEN